MTFWGILTSTYFQGMNTSWGMRAMYLSYFLEMNLYDNSSYFTNI